MDNNQIPKPEGRLSNGRNDEATVGLYFEACQKRICFIVNLKDGVSRPPEGQRFGIRVVHSRNRNNIVLSPAEGFITETSKYAKGMLKGLG